MLRNLNRILGGKCVEINVTEDYRNFVDRNRTRIKQSIPTPSTANITNIYTGKIEEESMKINFLDNFFLFEF